MEPLNIVVDMGFRKSECGSFFPIYHDRLVNEIWLPFFHCFHCLFAWVNLERSRAMGFYICTTFREQMLCFLSAISFYILSFSDFLSVTYFSVSNTCILG